MAPRTPAIRAAGHSAAVWARITWRLLAMVLLLALCLPPCCLAHYRARHGEGLRLAHRANPWPRRFLRGIARIAGVRLRVAGAQAPGRRLILANHVSWLDIPVLSAATGSAFVAHDGLSAVPLLHGLCRLAGTVFVARHAPHRVAEQVAALRAGLGAALGGGGGLALFPEGTTSDGTGLLPFKSALLAALEPGGEQGGEPGGEQNGAGALNDLAVQPVWLDYGRHSAAIAWVGTEPGLANFLRILARPRPLAVTLHLLPPLTVAERASRKAMTQAARARIAAAMAACPAAARAESAPLQ